MKESSITINSKSFDIDANELRANLDVIIRLDEVASEGMMYGREGVIAGVSSVLVKRISDRLLNSDFQDEIIKKVDIETIAKRIQLRVVARLTGEEK